MNQYTTNHVYAADEGSDVDMDSDMAYSPSKANSDDESTSPMKNNVPNISSVNSIAPKLSVIQSSVISSNTSILENMNNNQKKRKFIPSVGKLKKVMIKGFNDDDDDGDEDSNDNRISSLPSSSSPNLTKSISSSSFSSSSSLPQVDMSHNISMEQLEMIKKTARWAVANPDKIDILMNLKCDDPMMKFLYDKNSIEGSRYQQEYLSCQREKEIEDVCSGVDVPPTILDIQAALADSIESAKRHAMMISSSYEQSSSSSMPSSSPEMIVKRVKTNRWGPPVAQAIASSTITTTTINILSTTTSSSSSSSSYIDPRQAAQLQEQKELQLLESRIREAAKAQHSMMMYDGDKTIELHQERLKQYSDLAARDNHGIRDTIHDVDVGDGIIDGGTWEHRKRAKEMLYTASSNLELTSLGNGKHHISDFLPKEELDKFFKKSSAFRDGHHISSEDYSHNHISQDNIGYQMLSRAGWEAGRSLGVGNNGISAPILPTSSSNHGSDHAGVGMKNVADVDVNDDNYDEYRKRMMLAYRFRPNPMNNPRRSYY